MDIFLRLEWDTQSLFGDSGTTNAVFDDLKRSNITLNIESDDDRPSHV